MNTKTKGPWIHRLAIHFFTVVLAIIVFWLLGFLVGDIRSIPGPDYNEVAGQNIDPAVAIRGRKPIRSRRLR